jgi:aspartate-semialdehyde dehydrogenase
MKVGFIGYRGMVGSVLIKRMLEENDFALFTAYFFSTSIAGQASPYSFSHNQLLLDAYNIEQLSQMDCIITTQGSDYTHKVYTKLRQSGYTGYFIDASSALRLDNDSIIALDPVNRNLIDKGLANGIKTFVGGNCSITLSMIGLSGLFKANLIDWMSMMTYQAASGAGASQVRELLKQMLYITNHNQQMINDDNTSIIELIDSVTTTIRSTNYPKEHFATALAGSVIPWIDADNDNGSSKEELKAEPEANKILGLSSRSVKIDGLCVRVGVIRSHSCGITLRLKEKLTIDEIKTLICNNNPWVKYIENNKIDSVNDLNPVSMANSLQIAVGRLKASAIGDNIYNLFTVGDQLLWGAAEPLRRMLRIIVEDYC